jgi:hypothetical protein
MFAVDFFKEIEAQLEGKALSLSRKAMEKYAVTAENLKAVAEAYTFSQGHRHEPIDIDERSREAVEALKRAREAEAAALDILAEYLVLDVSE